MTTLFASFATASPAERAAAALLDRGARNEGVPIVSPHAGADEEGHGPSRVEDPATGARRPVHFEHGRAYYV